MNDWSSIPSHWHMMHTNHEWCPILYLFLEGDNNLKMILKLTHSQNDFVYQCVWWERFPTRLDSNSAPTR